MFPPPPNSQPIADQRVVPVNGPPFHWTVYATPDPPADVIAFYTRALGRAPDEADCRWQDPRPDWSRSAAVFPADQPDRIPPGVHQRVPADARTVVMLVERAPAARPKLERHQDNVLPADLSPASLLARTRAGGLVWGRSGKGPVLLAGGQALAGPHAGREIWIALGRQGRDYTLTLTSGPAPYGDPVRQRDGWLGKCELGRLWAAAERTVCGSASRGGPDVGPG